MINVYRFAPVLIYKGGAFPLNSVECTMWNIDSQIANKAFDDFSTKSISVEELEEMKNSHENVWILCEVQKASISDVIYNRYLRTEDEEIISYGCNFNFITEREKSFMPNGKNVPRKLYNSIY